MRNENIRTRTWALANTLEQTLRAGYSRRMALPPFVIWRKLKYIPFGFPESDNLRETQEIAMPRGKRPLCGGLLLLALLAGLTACNVLGMTPRTRLGYETALSGQAYLVCTQACRDRGQCGTAQRGDVAPFTGILVNAFGPATRNHSNIASHNSTVDILQVSEQSLVLESNSQQFTLNFYQVRVRDFGLEGWVAGWCIADQQLPLPEGAPGATGG